MGYIVGLCTLVSVSLAYANAQQSWGEFKKLRGSYLLYSGELGEEAPPTHTDRKVAIEIDGDAAKDLFDSMYPDFKPTCSAEKGDRDRRKGSVYYSFTTQVGYRCFIGINLRTGASISGGSC